MNSARLLQTCAILITILTTPLLPADRVTVPLDGTWQIEDGVEPDAVPSSFTHNVPVPGLANLASPAFPDVDLFDSRELIGNRVRQGLSPKSTPIPAGVGIPRQKRNYFWYSRTFRTPEKKQVAIIKINKAQFGTAVWLNGNKIGEHMSCFTAGYFNLTSAIDWSGENRLVVRIGAHPAAMPASVPAGTDFEKNRWTPGIYDSVSLQLSDSPVIETLQIAPKVVGASEVLVEVKLKNYSAAETKYDLRHRIKEWQGGKPAAAGRPERGSLKPGEEKVLRQVIAMPGARLWTPEDPFLYVLETGTGGDSAATRFGMREFRFDTPSRRAMLNGKVYFLRGSNITLHRFFEDPECKGLPWDEAWVRKLLVEIPKKMSWNTFRFCIGPVPDKWLEIADEAGLLIQNEYFIWTLRDGYHKEWDTGEMITQYKEWMRDNWNHPSVVIWDANNETLEPVFGEKIIPAVRPLDLSNRPWENSYNHPVDPDDPVEDHPYLFSTYHFGGERIQIADLEKIPGRRRSPLSGHAMVLNEYGWLWLNRDGTPTLLTKKVYDALLGPGATPKERFALNGYLLGGKTEFWRSRRRYAGILHFVYLTSSDPLAFTADHFQDLKTLTLEPNFEDYVSEAFKPVGVYIHFWRPELEAGSERPFAVMVVNDEHRDVRGRLTLTIEGSGSEVARTEKVFSVPANGQQTYLLNLRVPDVRGDHVLKAVASASEGTKAPPTVSRRKVAIVARPASSD
jgi:hypothetical protein